MRGHDAVVAVRVCRHCGYPVGMEPEQDDETRPFVCRDCLSTLWTSLSPPWWAEGAEARLTAVSL